MCEECVRRGKYMEASAIMASKEHELLGINEGLSLMTKMSLQSFFGVVSMGGQAPREARIKMLDELKETVAKAVEEIVDAAMDKINERQPEGTGGDNVVPLNVRLH